MKDTNIIAIASFFIGFFLGAIIFYLIGSWEADSIRAKLHYLQAQLGKGVDPRSPNDRKVHGEFEEWKKRR